jgi:HAD superfamily hydrolase (TIGR01509 family)
MLKPHHRAIVFDCDGTLADSMPVHWIAWHQTLKNHGLDHLVSHERFLSLGGVPALQIFALLAEESGRELDSQALTIEKYEAYFEHADQIQPIALTVELARQQHGKLPMAVATGSTRKGVTRTLTAIGMQDFFDTVVTAEDVTHPKPHPETFLRAAELLGVAPEHCLAFEDAAPGLASARAAGMDVIDVNKLLSSQP